MIEIIKIYMSLRWGTADGDLQQKTKKASVIKNFSIWDVWDSGKFDAVYIRGSE